MFRPSAATNPEAAAVLAWADCNDWLDCAWAADVAAACRTDAAEMAADFTECAGQDVTADGVAALADYMATECRVYAADCEAEHAKPENIAIDEMYSLAYALRWRGPILAGITSRREACQRRIAEAAERRTLETARKASIAPPSAVRDVSGNLAVVLSRGARAGRITRRGPAFVFMADRTSLPFTFDSLAALLEFVHEMDRLGDYTNYTAAPDGSTVPAYDLMAHLAELRRDRQRLHAD